MSHYLILKDSKLANPDKARQTIINRYGSIENYNRHIYQTKVDKYAGGDEAKYKQLMRDWQKKSREHYSGDGGFRSMDPKKSLEIQRLGGKVKNNKV